jgi:hypothetical protein
MLRKAYISSGKMFSTLELWLKKYPIQISLSAFFISLVLYIIFAKWLRVSLVIAFFGSIFIALKYKLDQANFHKDLFEKRYECVLAIEIALSEWVKTGSVSSYMVTSINRIKKGVR